MDERYRVGEDRARGQWQNISISRAELRQHGAPAVRLASKLHFSPVVYPEGPSWMGGSESLDANNGKCHGTLIAKLVCDRHGYAAWCSSIN